MYYIKLFTNDWENPNDIEELNCSHYEPVPVYATSYLVGTFSFTISGPAKANGSYIISNGELLYHQKFESPVIVNEGKAVKITVKTYT